MHVNCRCTVFPIEDKLLAMMKRGTWHNWPRDMMPKCMAKELSPLANVGRIMECKK